MKGGYNTAAADVGGTGGKISLACFDGERLSLREEYPFKNREVLACGALYWDALSLYADIRSGLDFLKTKADIMSLGIDTWGVDFGLLDKNLRLMGNIYHMRDYRTKGMPEEVFKTVPERELFYETASDSSRFYGLFQLYETLKNSRYMLDNAKHLMFTPDLLNFFFTCEVGKSDITMAGTSQLLNGSMTAWNFDLFERLGLPAHFFNTLGYPGEMTGKTPDGIDVMRIAGHDSASAAAVLRDGVFYVSGGTFLVTGFKSGATVLNDAMIAHGFKNTTGPDHKYLVYKNVTGFWTLKECMSEFASLGTPYSYDDMVDMAKREQPFRSLINIDLFSEKKPSMLGAIREYCKDTGQSVPDTPGKIARCLYESYAMQVKDCYLASIEISGKRHKAVYVINGAYRNKFLCQLIADATGLPVYAGMPRATLMGNAGIQLISAGEIGGFEQLCDVAENSTPFEEYLPHDTNIWDEEYTRAKPFVIS